MFPCKIGDTEFHSFDEIRKFAFEKFKITYEGEDDLSSDQLEETLRELIKLIAESEM